MPIIICCLLLISNAFTQENATQFTSYRVKPSDTLMLIAFAHYSDHRQWKQILADNQDQLNGTHQLTEGVELKLRMPLKPLEARPTQNPYLIKTGDTLGGISIKVYGQPKHWKDIYHNNRNQIHDPNLIFAGFTLYYRDLTRLPALYQELH